MILPGGAASRVEWVRTGTGGGGGALSSGSIAASGGKDDASAGAGGSGARHGTRRRFASGQRAGLAPWARARKRSAARGQPARRMRFGASGWIRALDRSAEGIAAARHLLETLLRRPVLVRALRSSGGKKSWGTCADEFAVGTMRRIQSSRGDAFRLCAAVVPLSSSSSISSLLQ